MPMTLDRLNDDGNKTITIQKGPDTLNFTYNRKDYTVRKEAQLNELARQRRMGEVYAEFLGEIGVSWDVVNYTTEDDRVKAKELCGEARADLSVEQLKEGGVNFTDVPLNQETLFDLLGVDGVIMLVNAIGEDNRPNETNSDSTNAI